MRSLVVTNMYPTKEFPDLGAFVEQQISGLKQTGVDVEMVFADRRNNGMGVYRGLGAQVRAKAAEFKPDIIHIMYGGIMAELVTRAVPDKPIIVTFHGSDLLGQHFSSGVVRKMIAAVGVWASWRAAHRANGIIAVSESLAGTLPNFINRSKVNVIPCGIDLGRFKPLDRHMCRERLGWNPLSFHVIFAANTGDSVKRPQLAQAAVRDLNASGVPAEIHYIKGIPNKEVPVWINASDALLLTSLHEGSPTIVKEALACNVPVVSVDVGDVRERIQDIEGCHIASPDCASLAAKLMLVHRGLRSVEGRSKIHEFSSEQIALRIKSVYKEVTGARDQKCSRESKLIERKQSLPS